jgi:hypothetical protein
MCRTRITFSGTEVYQLPIEDLARHSLKSAARSLGLRVVMAADAGGPSQQLVIVQLEDHHASARHYHEGCEPQAAQAVDAVRLGLGVCQ